MKTVIAEVRNERLTIGLDLGDKSSAYCVLDGSGEVVSEHRVRTTPKALSLGPRCCSPRGNERPSNDPTQVTRPKDRVNQRLDSLPWGVSSFS